VNCRDSLAGLEQIAARRHVDFALLDSRSATHTRASSLLEPRFGPGSGC
jgi:hypothetical protein